MNKKLTTVIFSVLIIFTSIPLYSQWIELNTGISTKINSINSIKGITTWACGDNGTVIKSYNNGDTWQNGNLGGISESISLNHVYCLSTDIVLAAGNDLNNSYLFIPKFQ